MKMFKLESKNVNRNLKRALVIAVGMIALNNAQAQNKVLPQIFDKVQAYNEKATKLANDLEYRANQRDYAKYITGRVGANAERLVGPAVNVVGRLIGGMAKKKNKIQQVENSETQGFTYGLEQRGGNNVEEVRYETNSSVRRSDDQAVGQSRGAAQESGGVTELSVDQIIKGLNGRRQAVETTKKELSDGAATSRTSSKSTTTKAAKKDSSKKVAAAELYKEMKNRGF